MYKDIALAIDLQMHQEALSLLEAQNSPIAPRDLQQMRLQLRKIKRIFDQRAIDEKYSLRDIFMRFYRIYVQQQKQTPIKPSLKQWQSMFALLQEELDLPPEVFQMFMRHRRLLESEDAGLPDVPFLNEDLLGDTPEEREQKKQRIFRAIKMLFFGSITIGIAGNVTHSISMGFVVQFALLTGWILVLLAFWYGLMTRDAAQIVGVYARNAWSTFKGLWSKRIRNEITIARMPRNQELTLSKELHLYRYADHLKNPRAVETEEPIVLPADTKIFFIEVQKEATPYLFLAGYDTVKVGFHAMANVPNAASLEVSDFDIHYGYAKVDDFAKAIGLVEAYQSENISLLNELFSGEERSFSKDVRILNETFSGYALKLGAFSKETDEQHIQLLYVKNDLYLGLCEHYRLLPMCGESSKTIIDQSKNESLLYEGVLFETEDAKKAARVEIVKLKKQYEPKLADIRNKMQELNNKHHEDTRVLQNAYAELESKYKAEKKRILQKFSVKSTSTDYAKEVRKLQTKKSSMDAEAYKAARIALAKKFGVSLKNKRNLRTGEVGEYNEALQHTAFNTCLDESAKVMDAQEQMEFRKLIRRTRQIMQSRGWDTLPLDELATKFQVQVKNMDTSNVPKLSPRNLLILNRIFVEELGLPKGTFIFPSVGKIRPLLAEDTYKDVYKDVSATVENDPSIQGYEEGIAISLKVVYSMLVLHATGALVPTPIGSVLHLQVGFIPTVFSIFAVLIASTPLSMFAKVVWRNALTLPIYLLRKVRDIWKNWRSPKTTTVPTPPVAPDDSFMNNLASADELQREPRFPENGISTNDKMNTIFDYSLNPDGTILIVETNFYRDRIVSKEKKIHSLIFNYSSGITQDVIGTLSVSLLDMADDNKWTDVANLLRDVSIKSGDVNLLVNCLRRIRKQYGNIIIPIVQEYLKLSSTNQLKLAQDLHTFIDANIPFVLMGDSVKIGNLLLENNPFLRNRTKILGKVFREPRFPENEVGKVPTNEIDPTKVQYTIAMSEETYNKYITLLDSLDVGMAPSGNVIIDRGITLLLDKAKNSGYGGKYRGAVDVKPVKNLVYTPSVNIQKRLKEEATGSIVGIATDSIHTLYSTIEYGPFSSFAQNARTFGRNLGIKPTALKMVSTQIKLGTASRNLIISLVKEFLNIELDGKTLPKDEPHYKTEDGELRHYLLLTDHNVFGNIFLVHLYSFTELTSSDKVKSEFYILYSNAKLKNFHFLGKVRSELLAIESMLLDELLVLVLTHLDIPPEFFSAYTIEARSE